MVILDGISEKIDVINFTHLASHELMQLCGKRFSLYITYHQESKIIKANFWGGICFN